MRFNLVNTRQYDNPVNLDLITDNRELRTIVSAEVEPQRGLIQQIVSLQEKNKKIDELSGKVDSQQKEIEELKTAVEEMKKK